MSPILRRTDAIIVLRTGNMIQTNSVFAISVVIDVLVTELATENETG